MKSAIRPIIVLCMLLIVSAGAAAEPGRVRPDQTAEPRRSYGAIDVILYQTSWWGYCNKAREFLRGIGVTLTEYDIEKEPSRRDEMIAKSGSRGVPVVDVEGIVIRGYSSEAMRAAIEQRRRDWSTETPRSGPLRAVTMPKVTIPDIYKKKAEGRNITVLTAYDYPTAQIVDQAGIDIILVGDSLAMVVQGIDSTLPVTMDEMIYHTKLVSRAAKTAFVVGDMPFLSYQSGVDDAVRNAGRFLKEAGAEAVKLEGGTAAAGAIRAIVAAGIPVMGHVGLLPQSVHMTGGFKVQGKDEAAREKVLADARAVQDAGAFSVVLEAIPAALAEEITGSLRIPTIGIGAGPRCDGQVLVLHDLLGLFDRFTPKFVKRYAALKDEALRAVREYKRDVENGSFPSEEQSFK